MSEWKHFELDSKEYEYTYSLSGDLKISYRKREPLPPTHEEIMTLWWKDDHGNWYRVLEYIPKDKCYLVKDGQNNGYTRIKVEGFTNRESAVIPPEVV